MNTPPIATKRKVIERRILGSEIKPGLLVCYHHDQKHLVTILKIESLKVSQTMFSIELYDHKINKIYSLMVNLTAKSPFFLIEEMA